MKLKDQVSLITGGAGYLGRATALRLAQEGAAIAVCDINVEGAKKVASEIVTAGGKAAGFEMNVRSTESIEKAVKEVLNTFGQIDILVNMAGGSARERASTVHGSKEEIIREIIDTNLYGTIFCCRAVIGHMIERKRGKIINIGSILGINGDAVYADYSAAKGGVITFTKALAKEVGKYNINVNCVSPGFFPRPNAPKEYYEIMPKTNYFGRIPKGESVAHMIAFLVSDEADFITGQNFVVDGGTTIALKGLG